MRNTFENFLQDRHANQYSGLDDEMGEDCVEWTGNLDVEELIEFAEAYGKKRFEAGVQTMADKLTKYMDES